MSDRLVIGTAQLGLTYGVANREGQVSLDAARAILSTARAAGVHQLDTAAAYGDSEARLGLIGITGWDVVTKLPGVPAAVENVRGWVADATRELLARLGVDRVKAVLLHRPGELSGANGAALAAGLQDIKAQGLADKVGISIYEPAELDELRGSQFDLVQAPFNVVDRRLEQSGWLDRLKDRRVEIHVRSAFLQGLLLMAPAARPAYFARWAALLSSWDDWLKASGITSIEACLGFVMARGQVDAIVAGVETSAQLSGIIAAMQVRTPEPPADVASIDPDLVNPARWRL